MRIRHRVPSIFSLSMVDMLCCALGCVILVWLLNAKQAEDTAAEQRGDRRGDGARGSRSARRAGGS